MKATKSDIEQIERNSLGGTSHYYRHGSVNLTDGVKMVCEKAEAYWLIDLIASYQGDRRVRQLNQEQSIQFWRLEVKGSKAVVYLDRDEGDTLLSQKIEHTDFPEMTFKIWYGVYDRVVYLPSEH